MALDGSTSQFLVIIFALMAGPRLLAMLPSVDPLVVIIGIFMVLGLVQQLGLQQDERQGGGERARDRPQQRGGRSGGRPRVEEVEEDTPATAGGKTAEHLISEAQRALEQNGYQRAAELAKKATDADPESAKAWELFATAQKWQGLRKEAAATVKKAREMYEVDSAALRALAKELASGSSPLGDAKARASKGDDFHAKRQYDLAYDCYGQALEALNGSEADQEFRLQVTRRHAECAQQLQDWGACRRSATVVLEADPNDKQALLQRAAANEALEKFSAAMDDARKLLSLDPKNTAANRIVHHCNQALRD